jgi:hypothetical protein
MEIGNSDVPMSVRLPLHVRSPLERVVARKRCGKTGSGLAGKARGVSRSNLLHPRTKLFACQISEVLTAAVHTSEWKPH